LLEKGVLMWCDQFGVEFPDTESLEKAKRSGKSYIRIKNSFGLPSPYELTRDSRWRPGGELDCTYDLGLDDNADEDEFLDFEDESPEEAKAFSFSELPQRNGVQSEGVKVLRQKVEVKNENDKIKREITETDIETKTNELLNEFKTVLSSEKQDISDLSSKDLTNYQKSCEQKFEIHENGILTI